MSFLERWKTDGLMAAVQGDDGEQPTKPTGQASAAQAPPVVPTTFVQTTVPGNHSIDLPEASKQALVETAARQVPHLQKLLDAAAVIADDVPDLQKRLAITAKQLRAAGQFDVQQALAGMRQAVAGIAQTLRAEVSQEEAQNVTAPSQHLAQLETHRQSLIQQAEELATKMGTIRLQIATAQDALAKNKGKCDAGVAFMETWKSQMEQLLNGLK